MCDEYLRVYYNTVELYIICDLFMAQPVIPRIVGGVDTKTTYDTVEEDGVICR